MAQPTRMSGTVYHPANYALCMMGRFIQSPTCREYSGYDWRHSSPAYKRFKKRALSRFRRRDGKRWINEADAAIREEQAMLDAEEQARLDAEYAPYAWDDSYYDAPDYDDESRYYDHWNDDVYYGAEAEAAQQYRLQQEME